MKSVIGISPIFVSDGVAHVEVLRYNLCKLYYSRDNKHGIRKLKSNKTYYVRVRLVKKDNKQIVGKWSKVRRIKVK